MGILDTWRVGKKKEGEEGEEDVTGRRSNSSVIWWDTGGYTTLGTPLLVCTRYPGLLTASGVVPSIRYRSTVVR